MNVAIIRKNDTAQVRISRGSYQGRDIVDIRVWFIPRGGGDFVASGKGVTLDARKCDELIEALKAVSE